MNRRRAIINEVRALLLVYIDRECNEFITQSKVKINHYYSKDFVKQFEPDYIIRFDNSLVRGTECIFAYRNDSDNNPLKEKSGNSSSSHSLILFNKCAQEIGKSFIKERKIDLGSRKLGFKQSMSGSDKSFCVKLKSSQSLKRYKPSKFAILSKRELKEKLIKDNLNHLTSIVKQLKIIIIMPIEENEQYIYSDINGKSPFQCSVPMILDQNADSNCLKEEASYISNDNADWITPFKHCDLNKETSGNFAYQTETEACRSVKTVTSTALNKTKTDNVSSFML